VNKITLGVPARDKPHLDEPAAVGGADPARYPRAGRPVVLRKPDASGGHAPHHLIGEQTPTGFQLQGKIF
jgi:hypothetical protein